MASKNTTKEGKIGLGMILFLIFLVLKLTNYITWSWWWVTAPLWIPIAIVLSVSLIIFAIFYIAQRS